MRRKKREFLTFELTPLIDVVFLLLIFFMVSSVFKKDELALLLNLPQTSEGEGNKKKNNEINIEVSKDKFAYQNEPISLDELTKRLSVVDKSSSINVRVDAKVEYNRLINVLEIFQKYSLGNISLITKKK